MIEARRMTSTASGALVALVTASAIAHAQPRGVPVYGATDNGPSVLLSNADGTSPYSGIVRYAGRATCTGVFLATFGDDDDPRDAPAYVLTNGHCPDFPGSNSVILDRPAPASHRVVFDYFADTAARQTSVAVSRISYTTMKGQDIAVLELAARYADVIRAGFAPWRATSQWPLQGEPAAVVGAPLTGTAATSFLRVAACKLESRADVLLEYVWHWFDFERNRCRDIQAGSSGSPVISRRTGALLGLVNTTTIGAVPHTDCALNDPCEPSPGHAASRANTSYMTPLVGIRRCFAETGRFDVTRASCPLDPGQQAVAMPAFRGAVNPKLEMPILGPPRRQWNVRISGPFDYYRYKIVPAAGGDCRHALGYSKAWSVQAQPVIDDRLPSAEGFHFLCLIGGTGTQWYARWQSTDHPTVVAVRIDTTPPDIPAPLTITEGEVAWFVEFHTVDPEISTYRYKFGRPADTRCDQPADYRLALIPFIPLPKANRPYLFCAIAYDAAQNAGTPIEALLP
jgi:Trypsin-like peptidase domain